MMMDTIDYEVVVVNESKATSKTFSENKNDKKTKRQKQPTNNPHTHTSSSQKHLDRNRLPPQPRTPAALTAPSFRRPRGRRRARVLAADVSGRGRTGRGGRRGE